MSRPRSYIAAAILLVGYSLLNAFDAVPRLASGATEDAQMIAGEQGPPYFLVVITFVLVILGFVAAYGAWRAEKWGIILAIAVSALNILTNLPAVIFAPLLFLRIAAVIGILWCAAIIVLLLRAAPRLATI